MNIIRLANLDAADIRSIWNLVAASSECTFGGTVAWSFEGNGIRTRTTFIQAFRELGMVFTELPNLLKTGERPRDLAGYLDPFYDLYVVRESNHARLEDFGAASCRPVINAMSSAGHPCEVLTDAYYVEAFIAPLEQVCICLWGPPTNVLRSWHELAYALGFSILHICDSCFHEVTPNVKFTETIGSPVDVVITDAWPNGFDGARWSLTKDKLAQMGNPKLLPTPPFTVGHEIGFDPLTYAGFVGYKQKELLLPVHKAILRHALEG